MKLFSYYVGFSFSILVILLTSLPESIHADQPTIGQLTITAGKHPIENSPVFALLPETGFSHGSYFLIDQSTPKTKPISAQIERRQNAPDRLWWILTGRIAAGSTRIFDLKSGKANTKNGVSIKDTGKGYQFLVGKQRVLNYNHQHIPAPENLHPLYGRSAHIHPIWTPGGKIVSDEFPPDHAHQSGQFLAYTKCTFEGRETNFWEIKSKKGRVRFQKRLSQQAGPVFAELKVQQEHVDLTGSQEKAALLETWTIRVWNPNKKNPTYWIYDLSSNARCATEKPLYLPKYHYGGMAIRGGRGWTKETCRFLTSNGKTRENGNHDRAQWCDISGRKNNETVWSGFCMLSHPANFRHPEPVRLHPSMPYMVFTPSALGDWKIEPDSPNISRYRCLVHDGLVNPQQTEQLWQNYASPPQAKLQLVTK